MSEKEERAYEAGYKRAGLELLGFALRMIEPEHVTRPKESYIKELHEAREQLRHLCEEFGDNTFDDDLYLGDAIEKYLGKHLHDRLR